jgi:hypothetical protein
MSITKVKIDKNNSEFWDELIRDTEIMLADAQDRDQQRRLRFIIRVFEYRRDKDFRQTTLRISNDKFPRDNEVVVYALTNPTAIYPGGIFLPIRSFFIDINKMYTSLLDYKWPLVLIAKHAGHDSNPASNTSP